MGNGLRRLSAVKWRPFCHAAETRIVSVTPLALAIGFQTLGIGLVFQQVSDLVFAGGAPFIPAI